MTCLRVVSPQQAVPIRRDPVDAATVAKAAAIVQEVRQGGERVLRSYAERWDDLAPDQPLVLDRAELQAALETLPVDQRDLLLRVAERIQRFARAQHGCFTALTTDIPGGRAGHDLAPVARAGCYAPGGRYPLPSTVLMTAVTARVAGVQEVWLASPRPQPITQAAAAVAGVDRLLCAGGAQAVAALAFGTRSVAACDVVVGPGNRWVTAAKQLVSGHVGIDMLAGPSELVVLADDTADPALVAADLLAQAEHDEDAVPVLVTTKPALLQDVEAELLRQLEQLPSAATAAEALRNNGCAVLCRDLEQAVATVNRLAPEHLQVVVSDPDALRPGLTNFGALFLGPHSAEVLADYGAGPNHVLPTGGGARFAGGLSVLDFLRARTWIEVADPAAAAELYRDAAALAALEGLAGHARAAKGRLPGDVAC